MLMQQPRIVLFLLAAMVVLATGCHRRGGAQGSRSPEASGKMRTETGVASYYADKFEGRKTASGEPYRANRYTCAHRTLPFGTMVTVTNKAANRTVQLKVNDRGPWAKGRLLDVSKIAAKDLDLIRPGTATVIIRYKQ